MCGAKVGLSLLYGAVLGFGILGLQVTSLRINANIPFCSLYFVIGPIVDHLGWTPGPVSSYENGVHGWLLWPGVTLMVCDAITNMYFLVNWTKIYDAIRGICSWR